MERIAVSELSPMVDEGRHPAKAVVGEHVPVRAKVWREGHGAVGATVSWRGPDGRSRSITMTPVPPEALSEGESDVWTAYVVPDRVGLWTFRVDGWADPWSSWLSTVRAKIEAGVSVSDLEADLETGARLLERAARRPGPAAERAVLLEASESLRERTLLVPDRVEPAFGEIVNAILRRRPLRDLVTKGPQGRIRVDRLRALTGAWYEFFPRSTGGWNVAGEPVHGTFETARDELDRIAAMGFDVVYLPPIHPIGRINRKGRNNSLFAEPGDVGSPWAVGSSEGGHDAVHPDLGALEDFDAFVARANDLGLEVALDLALQCAPDHPWVVEHPEWFTRRPDGSIAYAENPPKRYQDIYPLDFDNDFEGLFAEILRVVRFWIDHGVRIFRVDNPHTKPPGLWDRLIRRIQEEAPDVLFLAEAFTRPARLYGLARLGFSQSYTYFTWRTSADELRAFGRELVAHADELRPNLFVNTPDILHASLQHGGPAMFAIRAALAATMGSSWGVYSGYELFENTALHEGSEEYLDSEKYQLRPRDFHRALAEGRSLQPWLTRLNEIRRAHPALGRLRTLRFHAVDNDTLIAYSKRDLATGDTVLVVVTLDPEHAREGTVHWSTEELEVGPRFTVLDEVSGEIFEWAEHAYVKLDPHHAVAHIAGVVRS